MLCEAATKNKVQHATTAIFMVSGPNMMANYMI
jgi:hypothetical protein